MVVAVVHIFVGLLGVEIRPPFLLMYVFVVVVGATYYFFFFFYARRSALDA